jgi:hypothetical protein
MLPLTEGLLQASTGHRKRKRESTLLRVPPTPPRASALYDSFHDSGRVIRSVVQHMGVDEYLKLHPFLDEATKSQMLPNWRVALTSLAVRSLFPATAHECSPVACFIRSALPELVALAEDEARAELQIAHQKKIAEHNLLCHCMKYKYPLVCRDTRNPSKQHNTWPAVITQGDTRGFSARVQLQYQTTTGRSDSRPKPPPDTLLFKPTYTFDNQATFANKERTTIYEIKLPLITAQCLYELHQNMIGQDSIAIVMDFLCDTVRPF